MFLIKSPAKNTVCKNTVEVKVAFLLSWILLRKMGKSAGSGFETSHMASHMCEKRNLQTQPIQTKRYKNGQVFLMFDDLRCMTNKPIWRNTEKYYETLACCNSCPHLIWSFLQPLVCLTIVRINNDYPILKPSNPVRFRYQLVYSMWKLWLLNRILVSKVCTQFTKMFLRKQKRCQARELELHMENYSMWIQ